MTVDSGTLAGPAGTADVQRLMIQHLALAAGRLAQEAESSSSRDEASRFRSAEALYRDLASTPLVGAFARGRGASQPMIAMPDGPPIPLVDLLLASWSQAGRPIRSRGGVDPLLLDAAEQLLRGLAWSLGS